MANGKLPHTVEYIYAYIRRSRQDVQREKKTDQDTLTEQRTLLEGILNKEYNQYNWDLYEEVGSGADAIEERPVFLHIIKQLEEAEPRTNALLVKDISRLGRGSYEQMGFVERIMLEKCIYIITPTQIFDPLDDNDMDYIKFHMFFANMEYSKITRRMREARYTYAAQGRWMTGGGGIPYGYKFNSFTQKLEPDEATAWVVQKIFSLYTSEIERKGYNAISKVLSNQGIPTSTGKTNWRPIVIRRMLRNPVYIGTVRFRTTRVLKNKQQIKTDEKDWIVVEEAHPPLVSKEVFEKAAKIMHERQNDRKERSDVEAQPLASILICSLCGNKMQRQYSKQRYKKKDGTTSVYHKEFVQCIACQVYMKYREVEEEIIRILQEDFLQINHEILQQRLVELTESEKVQQRNSMNWTDRTQLIKKQLADIDNEMTVLRRMLRKGQITDEEYEKDRVDIQKQKADKEKQIAVIEDKQKNVKLEEVSANEIDVSFQTVDDLYFNFGLSQGERNELLRGIFDSIVLEKTGKGTFNLHAYVNPKMISNTFRSS